MYEARFGIAYWPRDVEALPLEEFEHNCDDPSTPLARGTMAKRAHEARTRRKMVGYRKP